MIHFLIKIVKWLPAGLTEDPKEFLIAVSLAIAGLVQFILPEILHPELFAHLLIPYWVIMSWGVAFVVGGILTSVGIGFRGKLKRMTSRMLEGVGVTFLGSGLLSYSAVAIYLGIAKATNLAGIVIVAAIGVGLASRAFILMPGVYETILMREVDREVTKVSRGE